MIEIKISGNTPLEALASLVAFGLHAQSDDTVNQAASKVLDAEQHKAAKEAANSAPVTPATAAAPSIAPTVPTSQNPAGSAVGASPASTTPSNVAPMAPPAGPSCTAAQAPGPMTPPPAAPVQSIPVGQPAQAPINPVPTTAAPGYTQAQIAKAGADLITADPSRRQALNALLYQYGVQTLSQIPPEHYGAVATALRGMGANI